MYSLLILCVVLGRLVIAAVKSFHETGLLPYERTMETKPTQGYLRSHVLFAGQNFTSPKVHDLISQGLHSPNFSSI